MAAFSDQDRARLRTFLQESFDAENAGDMDAFARNFLHNAKVWDLLADHFPTATATAVKSVMMDAYAEWSRKG